MVEGVVYGNLPFSDMDYPEFNIDHDYWIWNYTPLPNIFLPLDLMRVERLIHKSRGTPSYCIYIPNYIISTYTYLREKDISYLEINVFRIDVGRSVVTCERKMVTLLGRHKVAMASQITSLTIVYSSVQAQITKKTPELRVTSLSVRNSLVTSDFPAYKASNAEKSFHLMT